MCESFISSLNFVCHSLSLESKHFKPKCPKQKVLPRVILSNDRIMTCRTYYIHSYSRLKYNNIIIYSRVAVNDNPFLLFAFTSAGKRKYRRKYFGGGESGLSLVVTTFDWRTIRIEVYLLDNWWVSAAFRSGRRSKILLFVL